MIAIVNYGLGNLHSVQKAVAHIGGSAVVTEDADVILKADKVILPGVGAFADGMDGLRERDLLAVLREIAFSRTPLLGICLGMQLLFEESSEQGQNKGLGIFSGKVVLFTSPGIKIPQIGWNQIKVEKESSLMRNIRDGDYVYFNHSYFCDPQNKEDILTVTDHGRFFASAVERENVFGVQFHPEKSQKVGLTILKNFVEL